MHHLFAGNLNGGTVTQNGEVKSLDLTVSNACEVFRVRGNHFIASKLAQLMVDAVGVFGD